MSHLVLEKIIQLTEINHLDLKHDQYEELFEKHNVPFYPISFYDSSYDSVWLTSDYFSIRIYENNCVVLKHGCPSYKFKPLFQYPNSISDIRNNFMVDGRIDEVGFVLAYGKDYQDEDSISYFPSEKIDKSIENIKLLYDKINSGKII